ncbi:MAG: division/cell wall cluster transcriptional repressor MraZ, partial [Bacteroidales bacterium]
LNRFVKKNNDFIRSYTAGVKIVELDSQDRFLISKDLIDYAGLKKNLVLTSVINKIEIWDKDQYEQALKKIDDFGALAEEVMGNIQPE